MTEENYQSVFVIGDFCLANSPNTNHLRSMKLFMLCNKGIFQVYQVMFIFVKFQKYNRNRFEVEIENSQNINTCSIKKFSIIIQKQTLSQKPILAVNVSENQTYVFNQNREIF
eukprot:TRINITY_DN426_c0_g1_i2.p4 TRINITY_DN426_c0_g1~~TRINITY_DN426_c0_g1_i2.p4  ORF type:complete len:113 (-),score=7.18 TRINITY_DN426_c0_g1_i2:443-781(-)